METNHGPVDRLTNCAPNSRDLIHCLISIFSSPKDIKRIFQLQGTDALRFMNIIDQVLDSSHIDDRLRGKCLLALRKVSGRCGELPRSHIITEPLKLSGERPLAGGGFADVWKGMYRNSQVAVKMLRIYRTDEMSKVKKRFCKEAVIWKWLRHPNILPFFGVSYDHVYKLALVSEWMPHGSIVQYLKSNRSASRPKLLLDVSKGLLFLHSRGVVHGDLKGENILINNKLDACLADFGLASFVCSTYSIAITLTEAAAGTPRWMAPELIDADLSNSRVINAWQPATDIYSLGMVSLEVFTGQVPFPEFRSDSVVFKVKSGIRPDRPLNTAPLGLSDDVWAMMELCWRHSWEDRPKVESVLACFEEANRNFVPGAITRPQSVSFPPDDDESEMFSLYPSDDQTLDANSVKMTSRLTRRSALILRSGVIDLNVGTSEMTQRGNSDQMSFLDSPITLAVVGASNSNDFIRRGCDDYDMLTPIPSSVTEENGEIFRYTTWVGKMRQNIQGLGALHVIAVDTAELRLSEPFSSVWPKYISRIDGAIVCYDSSDEQSFTDVEKLIQGYRTMNIPTVVVSYHSGTEKSVNPFEASMMLQKYHVSVVEDDGTDALRHCFSQMIQSIGNVRQTLFDPRDIDTWFLNPASSDTETSDDVAIDAQSMAFAEDLYTDSPHALHETPQNHHHFDAISHILHVTNGNETEGGASAAETMEHGLGEGAYFPDTVQMPRNPYGTLDQTSQLPKRSKDDISDFDSEDDVFFDFSLMSHIATRLRDRVPKEAHVKGGISYPRAFTGKDIVSTIQSIISSRSISELFVNYDVSANDRRVALQIARSLESELFFCEVEWGETTLSDGVDSVYMFLEDHEEWSDTRLDREELPTGVVTYLTKCYTPCCDDGPPCYAYSCPRKIWAVSVVSAPEEPQLHHVSHSASDSASFQRTESSPGKPLRRLPPVPGDSSHSIPTGQTRPKHSLSNVAHSPGLDRHNNDSFHGVRDREVVDKNHSRQVSDPVSYFPTPDSMESHTPANGANSNGHNGSSKVNEVLDLYKTTVGPPLVIPPTSAGLYSTGYFDYDSEEDDRFMDFSLLSHIAVRLRDKVPRATHVKGSIPYPRAFTGKDIVSTIYSKIQHDFLENYGISIIDRRASLEIARSLQNQLFFHEVEWEANVLSDGVEDIYMFLDDQEGWSDTRSEMKELPTGVITFLTKCYTPSCDEGPPCYAYSCPRKKELMSILSAPEADAPSREADLEPEIVSAEILALPAGEVQRQTIIRKVVAKEQDYLRDLELLESIFILPLRKANPSVIKPSEVDDFINDVFGNVLDVMECNRRLWEVFSVRQREHGEVIYIIGDMFLDAAVGFSFTYPTYFGHLPLGEKALNDRMESNLEFRLFIKQCSEHPDNAHRLDLKHFLNLPLKHLQQYPVLLEAIQKATAEKSPDAVFLAEAIEAMKNLYAASMLRMFQSSMCTGPIGKFEWHNLVPDDVRVSIPKAVARRQGIIFDLIKGVMSHVRDLKNIERMYVQPLRVTDPPIIPPERLNSFIQVVFHNFENLYFHHRNLLNRLHEIQREEHPRIRSISKAMYDGILNLRDAYLEYTSNYPIATFRIDEEVANNARFAVFVKKCVRHPDAHDMDMKRFINRPIPGLLWYKILLKSLLDETPLHHDDIDAIPSCLDLIDGIQDASTSGHFSATQKVELWHYSAHLIFEPGLSIDLDLFNENRSLIHAGKMFRQPETDFDTSSWTELFVLLFDNYIVMTKPKVVRDGVTKYHVYQRPIPLDLLTLGKSNDSPVELTTSRGNFKGGNNRHWDDTSPEHTVYPLTIHHINSRQGGPHVLFTETARARLEWKTKLEEAIGLRQESKQIFEVETLSTDTFLAPSLITNAANLSVRGSDDHLTIVGKVTCSVPFTAHNRSFFAIGCADGVWIGHGHDSKSFRKVLHLTMVTQCAVLEDFGILLVLADKTLYGCQVETLVPSYAYHIESPLPPQTSGSDVQMPRKLNSGRDVHFFSVGNLQGRTLVVYMKKKGANNVFRVLEPVVGTTNEKTKSPIGSRFLRAQRSELFKVYRDDFFLPYESFDVVFLKAKIAILCTKGFEIMDLSNLKSVIIPQREDPRLEKLAKRFESCQPMGMFRSNKDEFLLCYNEFGLYVDNRGDPSRQAGTVEWEGTAERIAFHAPYILLFDSRFIEIHHVETGRLVQIISGNDIRCTWDGRGVSVSTMPVTPAADGGWVRVSQEPRVHGVMNVEASSGPGRPSGVPAQHIFEMTPTKPLYHLGSSSSPNPFSVSRPNLLISAPTTPS